MTDIKKYRKENPWSSILQTLRQRCNNPKADSYPWYGGRGIKALLTLSEIKELWFRDKAYLMKKPSIDRLDDDCNYTFDNCQFIELADNIRKRNIKHAAKILQYSRDGKFIKEWESAVIASYTLNIKLPSIYMCKVGKRPTAGGFIWKEYKDNFPRKIII